MRLFLDWLYCTTVTGGKKSQWQSYDDFENRIHRMYYWVCVWFIKAKYLTVFLLCLFYNQPIKLGDHLNSILLGLCEDAIYSRVSVRTVLDACSAHIRNSNCAPSFSYVKQLVKLVLGSLPAVSVYKPLSNNLDLHRVKKLIQSLYAVCSLFSPFCLMEHSTKKSYPSVQIFLPIF